MVDRYQALERYSRLRDEGVISEEEFAAEKAKLLGVETTSPSQPSPGNLRQARVAENKPQSVALLLWTVAAIVALGLLLLYTNRQKDVEAPAPAPEPAASAIAQRPPACDSREVHDLLSKAVAADGSALSGVANIAPILLNAPGDLRTCSADLTIAGKGTQNREFQITSPADGNPARLTLRDDSENANAGTPPPQEPAASNTSEPSDAEIAADDGEHYQKQAEAAAAKQIEVRDDDGTPLCCVTIGDVARTLQRIGVRVTYDTSADGSTTLMVTDPSHPSNRAESLELNFLKATDRGDQVLLSSVMSNGKPQPNFNPDGFLRQKFHLHRVSESQSEPSSGE